MPNAVPASAVDHRTASARHTSHASTATQGPGSPSLPGNVALHSRQVSHQPQQQHPRRLDRTPRRSARPRYSARRRRRPRKAPDGGDGAAAGGLTADQHRAGLRGHLCRAPGRVSAIEHSAFAMVMRRHVSWPDWRTSPEAATLATAVRPAGSTCRDTSSPGLATCKPAYRAGRAAAAACSLPSTTTGHAHDAGHLSCARPCDTVPSRDLSG